MLLSFVFLSSEDDRGQDCAICTCDIAEVCSVEFFAAWGFTREFSEGECPEYVWGEFFRAEDFHGKCAANVQGIVRGGHSDRHARVQVTTSLYVQRL